MARSNILCSAFSGTVERDIDLNVSTVSKVYELISDRITSVTASNGDPYWTIYDEINTATGTLDRVFKSVGDPTVASGGGDASVYFRLQQTTNAINLTTYQDWSPVSSNTSTSFTANPGGARSSVSTVQAQLGPLNSYESVRYWMVVNPYGWMFCCNSEITELFGVDQPSIPAAPGNDGFARITTATTGSGDVTINLDRELSGTVAQAGAIQPGQRIWIVNQTPAGSSLVTAQAEIVTVQQVGNQKVTLTGVTNTYASSSLVGVDPMSCYCFTTANVSPTLYGVNRPDGGYSSFNLQIADYEFLNINNDQGANPNPSGLFQIFRNVINADQSSFGGIRGYSTLTASGYYGPQRDGDMLVYGNHSYLCLRSISTTRNYLLLGPFQRGIINS